MKTLRFIRIFFKFLGMQNDYLYPNGYQKEMCTEYQDSFPFQKPHLWKTRFGFKTAWDLAKILA